MRLALLAAVVLSATSAHASFHFGIDAGAGYWAVPTGTSFPGVAQFDAHVSLRKGFGKVFELGLRPGVMLNVSPDIAFGIPIDAQLRFKLAIVYLEALGGVAILLQDPAPVRAHAALGVGLTLLGFSFGVEGGYLMNGLVAGIRIGFSI